MPEFKTIRQTAATGLTSEHHLRQLVAQGRCPGVRSGNRFLVNVTALVLVTTLSLTTQSFSGQVKQLGLFLHGTDFLDAGAPALFLMVLSMEYTELLLLPVICAISETEFPLTWRLHTTRCFAVMPCPPL